MVDAGEIKAWQSERKKNEENRAWREILEGNIRRIAPDIEANDAAHMLAIQLRDFGVGLTDVLASDFSMKEHAQQMSINSTGYGTKTGLFLQALETTRAQYGIAVEFGKNLAEEATSGSEQHWQEVARKFTEFVVMSSGQPAEVFFNPMSSVFSIDQMKEYVRIFRFQEDIRGISQFEFETAVEKTDSRKIVKSGQAMGKAAPEDAEITIFAKQIAKHVMISDRAAKGWAAQFLEYARKTGGIGSFESLNGVKAETVRRIAFCFLSGIGYNSTSIETGFIEAIKDALKEIGETKKSQPGSAREIFAKQIAKPAVQIAQKEIVSAKVDAFGSFKGRLENLGLTAEAEKLIPKIQEAMKKGGMERKDPTRRGRDRDFGGGCKAPLSSISELTELDIHNCAVAALGWNDALMGKILDAFRATKKEATEIPPTEFNPKKWMDVFVAQLPWEITRYYSPEELSKHLADGLSEMGLKLSDVPGLETPAMEKLANGLAEERYNDLPLVHKNLGGTVFNAMQQATFWENNRIANVKEKARETADDASKVSAAFGKGPLKLDRNTVAALNGCFNDTYRNPGMKTPPRRRN